ncbi:MAG TPA: GTP-binding protein [Fimbriimonas sp.]|nr:GTP-binding protein [Fimbriimonas sp.]
MSAAIDSKPILRLSTAGSVDDGKSSLIGRLLYDTKSIFEDQLQAIELASVRRGSDVVELALLTDGLRAEREQQITIDVAYRYFATPKRKFIIADTPGHEQYTRNMVTGTSTSDLSIILIDARKGVLPQSKRHAAISALLGVRKIVVAVNKMDLVDFSEARFREIESGFPMAASRLQLSDVVFIPISALLGDNVAERSANTPWFTGPTLLEFLEEVEIPSVSVELGLRLPVQYVIRPDQDFRGVAGQIEAGSISPGDRVRILPSGRETRVAEVRDPDGPAETAVQGQAVVVTLSDHLDISRGEMLVSPTDLPSDASTFEAVACWMHEKPLRAGARYLAMHANRVVPVEIVRVESRIAIEELSDVASDHLGLNDIGKVVVRASKPLYFDSYKECRATGSLIFIDPGASVTVGAGLILGALEDSSRSPSAELVQVSGGDFDLRREVSDAIVRHLGSHQVSAVFLDETVLEGIVASEAIAPLAAFIWRQGIPVVMSLVNEEPVVRLSRFDGALGGWREVMAVEQGSNAEEAAQRFFNEPWSPAI